MTGNVNHEFLSRRQQHIADDHWVRDLTSPVRVLVAERSRLLAEALMITLEVEPTIEPIGYALDGWEALQLTDALAPDVIVVGSALDGLDSLELTALVQEVWPEIRIVLLAQTVDVREAEAAFASGVSSYVSYESSADDVLNAIAAVRAVSTRVGEPRQSQAGNA
jgi:DNA-binding NarL/FixJ family response regulator